MAAPPPPNDPSRASPGSTPTVCGAKFTAMLSCVEHTGTVNACHEKINEFLACERAVFRAALQRPPSGSRVREEIRVQRREVVIRDKDKEEVVGRGFMDTMQRMIHKQWDGCVRLVKSVGKEGVPEKVGYFSKRMITDMGVSCTIIRNKVGSFAERIRDFIIGESGEER